MSGSEDPQIVEWGPGKTARGRARLPSSRRREPPRLSCNLCRQRKMRCDREHPCGSCSQRGLGLSCAYPPGALRRTDRGVHEPAPTLQDRIHQLEHMVVDLMQKTSTSETSYESSPSATPAPLGPLLTTNQSNTSPSTRDPTSISSPNLDNGSMQSTRSGTSYVNSAHWAAVLDEITELKEHFEKEMQCSHLPPDSPLFDSTGPQLLLYGPPKHASKQEILASIPDRSIVDRLVSRYFNSFESSAVIHTVQFMKEYEEFWENQLATPAIWLGLLFTLMCLGAQFQKFRLDPGIHLSSNLSTEQNLDQMINTFKERIVQCLILGDYIKGGTYVLETLILYIAVEVFRYKDAEICIWILLGTVVQLAMRMGYYKDPTHFKGMSPFEAEMRKRVWATVVVLDLGISTQMGLPRLIKQWQTDVGEPLNLQDSDFDRATTCMPASRPETDLTPILYRIVKARMMTAIGHVWDFAADTRLYDYTQVIEMDKELQKTYMSIPDCLKWRSMNHCITDSPQVIIQKIHLDIMFQKAKIVLHQRYMNFSPTKTEHDQSQKSGLDAALKLLEYQSILHEETQPGCQLYHERWRLTSIVNHDFLLATSILCFSLKKSSHENCEELETSVVETVQASLKRSHRVWVNLSNSSKEAQKAADALTVVLGGHQAYPKAETYAFEQIKTSPSYTADRYQQDTVTSFGIRFPIFDFDDWSSPMNEDVFEDFLAPITAMNEEWQGDGALMDTRDQTN